MRKTATKPVSGRTERSRPKLKQPTAPVRSADDQLAYHLNQAEDHLIEAVKLFSGPRKVTRRSGYLDKLERAQESVTTLHREELVRVRGPVRRRSTK